MSELNSVLTQIIAAGYSSYKYDGQFLDALIRAVKRAEDNAKKDEDGNDGLGG